MAHLYLFQSDFIAVPKCMKTPAQTQTLTMINPQKIKKQITFIFVGKRLMVAKFTHRNFYLV